MFNIKSRFHKGSSVLVSALITAAASTLIGYGLTKMISTGIDAIKNQEVKMQGQQYAASRINVLRSVRFDSLSSMAKRQINDTDYYEEVIESDSTADRKNYAVNIYKGSDSVKPVAVMNLSRTATGALLDNQGADSYDSLGAGGNADSSALNTAALKNYTNDKFSADSDSFETDRAMDVKSFVSYVDGLLSKYRFRSNAVTVGPNGAGARQNPIYVSASDFECVPGSVTYAMTGNSHGYLATLTPAGNGLYYVDYTEKDVPDDTTGGGTGGGTGGIKPPGGNTEKQIRYTMDFFENHDVDVEFTEPGTGKKTVYRDGFSKTFPKGTTFKVGPMSSLGGYNKIILPWYDETGTLTEDVYVVTPQDRAGALLPGYWAWGECFNTSSSNPNNNIRSIDDYFTDFRFEECKFAKVYLKIVSHNPLFDGNIKATLYRGDKVWAEFVYDAVPVEVFDTSPIKEYTFFAEVTPNTDYDFRLECISSAPTSYYCKFQVTPYEEGDITTADCKVVDRI